MNEVLKLGCAYHSNRILRHVEEDMTDLVRHHMNTVIHMYTHNDMDRHSKVLKDIVAVSEDRGLDVWLDNWGIDAGPGDKCFFTGLHPETKMLYRDGTPVSLKPCYNQPLFRDFTRSWVDAAAESGAKTLFWDEPHIVSPSPEHGPACFCSECRRIFEEKFGHSMDKASEEELRSFRTLTVTDYFRFATDYAHTCGLTNTGCIMFVPSVGSGEELIDALMTLPHFDNVGCDPYWVSAVTPGALQEVYDYNYSHTRMNLDICSRYGKDHNLWLQGFGIPRGREEEMAVAATALYDAGARTIHTWSFRGGESNNYRSECPDLVWETIGEICGDLKSRWRRETAEKLRRSK